jgi:hypothetical protein
MPTPSFPRRVQNQSRLTLTFGVRYEPYLPWVERTIEYNGRSQVQSQKVPDAPIGVLFPGVPVPRGLADNDWNNFAPLQVCLGCVGRWEDQCSRRIRVFSA